MKYLILLLSCVTRLAFAGDPTAILPPDEVVARVLRNHPGIQAANGQVRVEEANRDRLEAGSHEWSVRLGSQQRRTNPNNAASEHFSEWSAALERPLRLPGKATLDSELGAAGIALAETARSDALHETSRDLLKSWFSWLRENAAATQWTAQVALLEKQAQGVQRRQQLGDAARLESIQAEAALAQAEAQLSQARLRLRIATEELRRRYPGLPLVQPNTIPEPEPLSGDEANWIEAIIEHSHELGLASAETRRALLSASRLRQEQLPDPSVGIQFSRERGGEEHVVGAYISIPLPGDARRATTHAALAQADVSGRREAAVSRKIVADAAALYHAADASYATWQAAHQASERLSRAAAMTARAYQLGEGTLNELLNVQRQANESALAGHLSRLDALEVHCRLLLDAHRLWDVD